MTSREIPDQNIISSSHENNKEPYKARFHQNNQGWSASRLPNQFLQIDLGITGTEILAIGVRHPQDKHFRVLEFFLSFSDEGSFWYQCMEYSKPKVKANNISYVAQLTACLKKPTIFLWNPETQPLG